MKSRFFFIDLDLFSEYASVSQCDIFRFDPRLKFAAVSSSSAPTHVDVCLLDAGDRVFKICSVSIVITGKRLFTSSLNEVSSGKAISSF